MKIKALTIFTPVYNRRDRLQRLYTSILSQTDREFTWLIVDDGSTDRTGDTVKAWIEAGDIDIQYIFQENQGKVRAIETAVDLCRTPWLVCVDSDDILPPSAAADMREDMDTALPPGAIGYIYPRQTSGPERKKRFPDRIKPIHIMDARNLYGIPETAILFRTEYLKQLTFPRFEGETFLSEEVLYIQLAEWGRFIPKNRYVYISEYCADGLTRNIFRHWLANPKGTILLLTRRYTFCGRYAIWIRVRERVKCIMNLTAFCMARHIPVFETTPNKWYTALLYCPSLIWRKIRFS